MIVRVLGNIPGPIIVGAIFDSSCAFWQEECGDRGNCYILNNEDLSLRLFLVSAAIRALSVLFGFLAWGFFNKTLCNRGIEREQLDEQRQLEDVYY